MAFRFFPIHRIPTKRAPVAGDEMEGQAANGGESFRFDYSDLQGEQGPPGDDGADGADGHCIVTTHSYSYGATVTVQADLYEVADVTLAGALTLNFSGGSDGKSTIVRLRQDGTGNRLLTLGTMVRVPADIPDTTLSTAADTLDYLVVRYNATDAKYDLVGFIRGFS